MGSFVVVPAGHYSITMGKDTTWVTLAGFRMLETEVTNASYNVAEMVYERGIAYGGSYLAPGYDIRIDSEKPYDALSPLIGFRVIAVRKR